MKNIYLILFLSLFISGCSTGPKYRAESISNPNNGTLYIYRENIVLGSAAKPSVFIDGKYFGLLSAGGYIRAEVSEGEHTIEVGNKSKHGIMGWGPEPYFHQTKINSTESKFLKLQMDNRDVHIVFIPIPGSMIVGSKGYSRVSLIEVEEKAAIFEIKKYRKNNK